MKILYYLFLLFAIPTLSVLAQQSISGNAGTDAVTISWVDGTDQSTTTDPTGNYSIVVPSGWTGDVIPSKIGYTFSPDKNSYINLFVDQTNQDFLPIINSYTIITSSNPTIGGTTTGGGNYNHGQTVNLTATPAAGYTFVNWTNGVTVVSTNASYSFSADSDINLTANFSINSYTITTSSNPTIGGTTTGGGNYNHGQTINLTATPAAGYTFVNWTNGATIVSVDSDYSFIAFEALTLTANFTLNNYVVSTSSSPVLGGITTGAGAFDHGDEVMLVATPVDGYRFLNWTEGDTIVSEDSIFVFTIETSRSLVANFIRKKYDVKLNINPLESGTLTGVGTYDHGTLVEIIGTPKVGWQFDNWKNEQNIVVDNDSSHTFVILSDREFDAFLSKKIYAISTSSDPSEGGVHQGTGNYTHDSLVTIIATPNEGWNFIGWFEDDKLVYSDSLSEFSANGARSLTAKFELKVYDIFTIRNPANGGETKGDSSYTHGDQVRLTAIPNSAAGYEFVNWTEDNLIVATSLVYSFIANKSTNVQANFRLKSYDLELLTNVENAGTVSGNGTFTHGDSILVSATPNDGWFFANWTDENNLSLSDKQSFKIMIVSDTTLKANFDHNLYNIATSSSPVEGGFVSGSGTVYFGQEITLSATPNIGWKFKNWTEGGNVVSSDKDYKFTVSGSRVLVANFSLENYSINCSVLPVEAGLTSGCGLAFFDDQMSLIAEANNGWKFINWTENGDTVSNSASYNFSVKGNRDLIANFVLSTGIEVVNNSDVIPESYFLSNAFPNPFNPSTTIEFGLPTSADVNVNIYNINGQLVENYMQGVLLPAGIYRSTFDGSKLSSGIYLFHISASSFNSSKTFSKMQKLILIK